MRLEASEVRALGRAIANGQSYDLDIWLEEFSNVIIINPQDGDVLSYDTASGKWVNKQP